MTKTKPKSAGRGSSARKVTEILGDLNNIRDTLAERKPVTMQWQLANQGANAAANSAGATRQERSEAETVMLEASGEIERMRHRMEILQAKVDMIDLFGLVLMTQPRSSGQGMGEDIAWKLRKVARDMGAKKESSNA